MFAGGETEALHRLQVTVEQRPTWTASFEKPTTLPTSITPATTVLSPYLKFGCLSAARFYGVLADIYATRPSHSKPPVSASEPTIYKVWWPTSAPPHIHAPHTAIAHLTAPMCSGYL
jgi:cryptochrome